MDQTMGLGQEALGDSPVGPAPPELSGEVSDLKSKVEGIQANNATMKSDLDTIKTEMQSINSTIKSLLAVYETVNKDFNPFVDHESNGKAKISRVDKGDQVMELSFEGEEAQEAAPIPEPTAGPAPSMEGAGEELQLGLPDEGMSDDKLIVPGEGGFVEVPVSRDDQSPFGGPAAMQDLPPLEHEPIVQERFEPEPAKAVKARPQSAAPVVGRGREMDVDEYCNAEIDRLIRCQTEKAEVRRAVERVQLRMMKREAPHNGDIETVERWLELVRKKGER
ncbi:MAG TPA: flagella accessory protein C [Methanomassiliicoccales archaeon]|nr:flagella accessory protein C [Methanomassiliicoccales archaeon]